MHTCSAAVLVGLAVTPIAAQTVQATLLAVSPITVSSYAGFGSQPVQASHPAGVLNTASVVASQPPGQPSIPSSFSCSLATVGDSWRLLAASDVDIGGGQTAADLLLVLVAPIGTTASLDISYAHFGDLPGPHMFHVDVDADGTVDSRPFTLQGMSETRDGLVIEFPTGIRFVRVTNAYDNLFSLSPQYATLQVDVVPWPANVTSVVPACEVHGQLVPFFFTNYHLAPRRDPVTGAPVALVGQGLGAFGLFLVSGFDAVSPLSLPAPFTGTCDLLVQVGTVVPGVVTATAGTLTTIGGQIPHRWELTLPPLPPGLTLFLQHGSVLLPQLSGDLAFGTTNVLRWDT